MGIRFETTRKVSDLIEATAQLQEDHWEEIAKNKHLMVLKPDEAKYRQLEEAGMIAAVFMYDGTRIVGYSVNFLFINLHYSDLLVGQNDLLYVAPEYRKGRAGIRLIQETERYCSERGARMMLWHAKEDSQMARLVPALGYGVQDIIFSKEI